MRSIRTRLFLILSVVFSAVVGLNLLSYKHFLELRGQREQIQAGQSFISELDKDGKKSEAELEDLEKKAKKLLPLLRQKLALETFEKFNENKNRAFRKHLDNLKINEAEFQRFTLVQMDYLEKKVLFLSALSGIVFLLGFALLHGFLSSSVMSPIQNLSSRMMEFLHNRFTYRFDSPANNEIGDLHSTFNSLAQRVINHTDELMTLDQAKSDFLSIASHELRTPLTSIKGSLSLLRGGLGGELNEVTQDLLSIAEAESDRLIRLINDLLDLAKIEAGKVPLNSEWVFAEELIDLTFDALGGLSQSAQVELIKELESPNLQVFIDRDRIQQVLTNLMSNAIKFSPQGETVHLKVKLIDENQVYFEVRDHGKGIDPQDQQVIFQKFRQATGPNNPLVKGTGLGLAIAKALIEEHEGKIGLKSTPGDGSSFYFTLNKWRFVDATKQKEAS